MQFVEALECDIVAALIDMLDNISFVDAYEPMPPGVPISKDSNEKPLYLAWAELQRKLEDFRNDLESMKPRYVEELNGKDISLRRFENLRQLNRNFNSRTDLLHNVDLAVSPGLKALGPYRNRFISAVSSSREVAEVPRVASDGQASKKPTKGEIQRYKAGGETNKQVAARFAEFFGYDKSNTDSRHWDTVYGRMKAFQKDKYKGHPRC